MLEWPDLDARLGLRSLAELSHGVVPDVLGTARAAADRLAALLERAAESTTVVLSLPTLPVPPVTAFPPGRANMLELGLRDVVSGFAVRVSAVPGVSIVSEERLNAVSQPRADST